jgi:hypothetical protein
MSLLASATHHAPTPFRRTELITETERVKEPNLWEGIFFFPDAAPESRFMATVIEGRRTKTIGLFANLESAVAARQSYLQGSQNE